MSYQMELDRQYRNGREEGIKEGMEKGSELATENIEDRYLWLLERLRKDFGRLERRLDEYYQGLDLKMEKLNWGIMLF